MRVLRVGRQWTVHVQAWRWLRSRLDHFDRVVDQINTIPFFTPAYVPVGQRRGWIHQLAREYWWRETRGAFRLISPIGYVAEPLYLRAYRGTDMLSLSESTSADLRSVGYLRRAYLDRARRRSSLTGCPVPPARARPRDRDARPPDASEAHRGGH